MLGSCLLAAAAGLSAATPVSQGERAQLLAEQQVMSQRFDRELAACRERFLVSDCIASLNHQRRVALAPLRERLLQIDETERQQRADARRATLAAKQKILEERMAGAQAAQAAQAADSASAVRSRQPMLPPAPPPVPNADRVEAEATRQQQAAERVRQAQRRQTEAAERQARVLRRQAERASGKGTTPTLPVPAALPAASAAR